MSFFCLTKQRGTNDTAPPWKPTLARGGNFAQRAKDKLNRLIGDYSSICMRLIHHI